jgi:hypothetical protein
MRQWQEIVESGVHKFHKDFVGVTLTITKLDTPTPGLVSCRTESALLGSCGP